MSNPARTEEEVQTILMALVAWGGNAKKASEALKAERGIGIGAETLRSWARDKHADRYLQLREKYSEQLEKQLAGDMRDIAMFGLDVQRKAIEAAEDRLDARRDTDPSRTASNLATVVDKMTAKMLALQGKPSEIREDRNVTQLLRSLISKGILSLDQSSVVPPEAEQVPNGTPLGEGSGTNVRGA